MVVPNPTFFSDLGPRSWVLVSSVNLSSAKPGAGRKAEDTPTIRAEAKIDRKKKRTGRKG